MAVYELRDWDDICALWCQSYCSEK